MNKVDTITAEAFLPDVVKRYPATRITPSTRVGDVLARYPQSLEIFVRRGFTPLRNPVLRKTMARVITIEQACRREDVDLTELLNELEHMVGDEKVNPAQLVAITRIDQAQLI